MLAGIEVWIASRRRTVSSEGVRVLYTAENVLYTAENLRTFAEG
jgi:hypothetical protein